MQLIAGTSPSRRSGYDADIVMLAVDRIEETLAAIASVFRQTGVSWHLTVLDQGSAPANLTRLAATLDGRPDACLFAADGNFGVAGGRNLASAPGRGRTIAVLDNDAEFATPDTVARMVGALDNEPALAAVGCRILRFADDTDDLLSWGYPLSLLPAAAESFDATTFVGAGHAIRRTAWIELGGYDPALFFCWEEFDFCLRAIARGWRVRYRGDIVVRHKVSTEQRMNWSGQRWFHFVRNRLYIGRKHGAAWLTLTPRICGYLIRGLHNAMPGQTLTAIAAAIRMSRTTSPHRLPPAARDYIRRNDTIHRGNLIERLGREVLAVLPDPSADTDNRARSARSRRSNGMMAGLSTK